MTETRKPVGGDAARGPPRRIELAVRVWNEVWARLRINMRQLVVDEKPQAYVSIRVELATPELVHRFHRLEELSGGDGEDVIRDALQLYERALLGHVAGFRPRYSESVDSVENWSDMFRSDPEPPLDTARGTGALPPADGNSTNATALVASRGVPRTANEE